MANTVRQLITASLRLINVIQANEAPSADDVNISLEALNSLIDSASNSSLMTFMINEYSFPLQQGKKTYTLGKSLTNVVKAGSFVVGIKYQIMTPGTTDFTLIGSADNNIGTQFIATGVGSGNGSAGEVSDWDVPRPMVIEQAYARLNPGTAQQLDIPMQQLTNSQYASVAVKNTPSTFPFSYYNDCDMPLSNITLFPVPIGPSSIVLWLREPLIDFENIDEVVNFPPGYYEFFKYNLAVRLAPEFGKTPGPDVLGVAATSKENLERLNYVPRYAHGDGSAQSSQKRKFFNWISGNFFPWPGSRY